MNKGQKILAAGGVLSLSVSLLHIAVIIGGAQWYRFFGAGERMASLAEKGSWIPGLVTIGITLVFLIWGLYAFSGAKMLRIRMPLAKAALVLIASIYIIRGLEVFPSLISPSESVFMFWSSLVSLSIGLVYAVGIQYQWPNV
jgi:hypothetical protein